MLRTSLTVLSRCQTVATRSRTTAPMQIPEKHYSNDATRTFKAPAAITNYARGGIQRKATPLPTMVSSIWIARQPSTRAFAEAPAFSDNVTELTRMDKWRMSPDDDGYQLVLYRNQNQLKKILLVSTSINSLTNAVHMHLQETGKYELAVAAVSSERDIQEVVEKVQPDLVICPYLTKKIPPEVYKNYICWIVHPGIVGDRGAYSIDYALLNFKDWKPESQRWGVTVLQAHKEYDAGAIWSTKEFPLNNAVTKSELYHTNVTRAAIDAIDNALESFKNSESMPISLKNYPNAHGHEQIPFKQKQRGFSWDHDSAKTIAQKINAASGQPGIKTDIFGEDYFFYNAYVESSDIVNQYYAQKTRFHPGQMVMKMNSAVLFATSSPDEFLWVTQMKKKGSFKLPAEQALKKHSTVPQMVDNLPQHVPTSQEELTNLAWKEIHYNIDKSLGVAYLHFDFCNGAMSTDQAIRLKFVYDYLSKERSDMRVIILMGGRDSFSNGIHLNVIHNAPDPIFESTRNIEAIDDVTKSILNTTDKLVISFIRCGAGAGGVMLPLAGDLVWCDSNAVLHPYYQHMGLYGSEYWTYSLPRRVGNMLSKQLTEECKPISAQHAVRIGLVDQLVNFSTEDGVIEVKQMILSLLYNFNWEKFLKEKAGLFDRNEAEKCRKHELKQMHHSFRSDLYKNSRHSFVH